MPIICVIWRVSIQFLAFLASTGSPSQVPPMRTFCARRGFTLIEMLLVVSIIVMLISLLLPSLSGSKCHAEKLQCMANMKAMGGGASYFITDNARMLPGPSWYGQTAKYTTGSKTLAQWLAPYMGYPKASGTANVNKQFICPSFAPVKPTGYALEDCVIYGAVSENNPATGKRVFGYPAFDGSPEYGPSVYTVVKNPSRKMAVKDIDQYNNPTAGWVAATARGPIHCYTPGAIVLRNALYFDWHVETSREFINGALAPN